MPALSVQSPIPEISSAPRPHLFRPHAEAFLDLTPATFIPLLHSIYNLHGRHHGQYWLFKSAHFHVDLETISNTFTGSVSRAPPSQPAAFQLELSLEELVRRTKPAVVCLKALGGTGSGFFIRDTGVIATNARVARGDSTLLALLPDGTQLQANAVYIGPHLDLALVKATAPSADFVFPYLSLADASLVHQGESVFVVGNPGDAMLFSVTKGMVHFICALSSGNSFPRRFGTITITSEPDAAEIFLDGKFHGKTPATLKLPAGSHTVLLKSPGYSDYSRTFELPKSSKLTLKAVFQTPPWP